MHLPDWVLPSQTRLKKTAAEELKVKEEQVEIKDEWVYVNGERSRLFWEELTMAAFTNRVSLSEHAHYAPPGIHFDAKTEKGHPFTYHVYGTSIITVTIDCLRGTYEFDSVKVVHDFGKSMNYWVDMGQCEGGIVQGIGWMTMEELIYDKEGKLRSNALSTYKVHSTWLSRFNRVGFTTNNSSDHRLWHGRVEGIKRFLKWDNGK